MGNVLGKTTAVTRTDGGKESFMPLKGVVVAEMKRCGKPSCRCNSGQLHGPYHVRYFRERGRLRKRYVSPHALQSVRAGIEARRQEVSERREARHQLGLLLQALKEMDLWGM